MIKMNVEDITTPYIKCECLEDMKRTFIGNGFVEYECPKCNRHKTYTIKEMFSSQSCKNCSSNEPNEKGYCNVCYSLHLRNNISMHKNKIQQIEEEINNTESI